MDLPVLDDIDTDTDANVTDTIDNVTYSMGTNYGEPDIVTESPDIDDDEPEMTESTDTGEPEVTTTPNDTTSSFYQDLECEPLDGSWMCSSGSKNHSLCIKFCTVG